MLNKSEIKKVLKKWEIDTMFENNNNYGNKADMLQGADNDMNSLIDDICAIEDK